MECLVLLSRGIHALVVRSFIRRKFSTHDEPEQYSIPVRYRCELLAPGFDRKATRPEGSTVVRGNGRILGWDHARYLDHERSGVDIVAFDVVIQRPIGDRRDVRSRVQ